MKIVRLLAAAFAAAVPEVLAQSTSEEAIPEVAGAQSENRREIAVYVAGAVQPRGEIKIKSVDPTAWDVWQKCEPTALFWGYLVIIRKVDEEVQRHEYPIRRKDPDDKLMEELQKIPIREGDTIYFPYVE